MDNLEKICNDTTAWIDYETDEGTLKVYARCFCGRYLKHGSLKMSLDDVKFQGWTCKKCGEVEPFHLID